MRPRGTLITHILLVLFRYPPECLSVERIDEDITALNKKGTGAVSVSFIESSTLIDRVILLQFLYNPPLLLRIHLRLKLVNLSL